MGRSTRFAHFWSVPEGDTGCLLALAGRYNVPTGFWEVDTASSSWGFLGNEEGPGARTRGLTQLGASLELRRPWGFSPEARLGSQGASRAAPLKKYHSSDSERASQVAQW